MINRSLNSQKEIKNNNGSTVGFLSSQVSIGYGAINFSIQIIDKDFAEKNPDIIKQEYEDFVTNIKLDAINNGWDALKDSELSPIL